MVIVLIRSFFGFVRIVSVALGELIDPADDIAPCSDGLFRSVMEATFGRGRCF